MKPPIYYVIYLSTASSAPTREDLMQILEKSREKNKRLGVTGMLLYKKGAFQQILEGPEAEVKALYETIRGDLRHSGVITLLEGYTEERQFPDWSMGFCDLDSAEAARIPGFTSYLSEPLREDSFLTNPGFCHTLMQAFKKNMD